MKSFALVCLSVCYLFAVIQAAAVDQKVLELQKDNTTEDSSSEKELSTNEDCIQPKETGRCFALFYRFAYDVEKRECVEFIYGGCSGNSNNFETKEDCEVRCLKNKEKSSEESVEIVEVVETTTVAANTETEVTTEPAVSP